MCIAEIVYVYSADCVCICTRVYGGPETFVGMTI